MARAGPELASFGLQLVSAVARSSGRAKLAIFAAALAVLPCGAEALAETVKPPASHVSFNQQFIEGLRAELDIADPEAVFAHVFAQLPPSVTVYPSENYFYWSLFAKGRTYWGNFRLDARDRDDGILHLGYFEYDENAKFQDYEGFEKSLGAADGVIVARRERFVYEVAFRGKAVTFRLFDPGMAPPRKAKLRSDEIFVGPVFDESGVRFHLIFNTGENRFHYLLNEDADAPETYKALGAHIAIGRRTGFAYYLDAENDRKILIAVFGPNALRNNYYDGPFDQLPDNYVDETGIKSLFERAYPSVKGKIDRFGHFTDRKGVRVAAYAYYVYHAEEQLGFVQSCLRARLPKAKFYACITPDPQKDRPPAAGRAAPRRVASPGP